MPELNLGWQASSNGQRTLPCPLRPDTLQGKVISRRLYPQSQSFNLKNQLFISLFVQTPLEDVCCCCVVGNVLQTCFDEA